MGGSWRWALVSPDGEAPSQMVVVSAAVNLPLQHKVQKFSSVTGSPGWSQKRALGAVVAQWVSSSSSSSSSSLLHPCGHETELLLHNNNGNLSSMPIVYIIHSIQLCLLVGVGLVIKRSRVQLPRAAWLHNYWFVSCSHLRTSVTR